MFKGGQFKIQTLTIRFIVLLWVRILLVLFWLFVAVESFGANPHSEQYPRIIHFVGDAAWPPYHFLNEAGEPDGFCIELAKAVCEKIKIRSQFKLYRNWSEAKQAVIDGRADVIVGFGKTAERAELFEFTNSFKYIHEVIVVRKGSKSIFSLKDLFGSSVAAIPGTPDFKRLSAEPRINVIPVPNEGVGLEKLIDRETNAIVSDREAIRYFAQKAGITDIKTVGEPLYVFEMVFGLTKGNSALARKIDQILAELDTEGKIDQLVSRWFKGELNSSKIPRWLMVLLGAVIFLTLISGFYAIGLRAFNRKLNNQIATRTRALLNSPIDNVYIIDHEGRIIQCNDAIATRLGGSKENLIGKRVSEQFPIENFGRLHQKIEKAFISKKSIKYKDRDKDRYFDTTIFPIAEDDATVKELVVFSHDVTEYQRAIETIQNNELTLRQLINTSDDSILLLDLDRLVIECNEIAAKRLKIDLKALIGCNIFDFLEGPVKQKRLEAFEEVLNNKQPFHFIEERAGIYFDSHVQPILNNEGEIIKVAVFARDITAQLEDRKRLEESEKKFNRIFQANPAGMVITQLADGKVLNVNETFTRLTGYSQEESFSRTSIEMGFWPKPEDREKVTQILRQEGKFENLEFEYRNRSGEIRLGSFSAEILDFDGEQVIVTAMLDITERHRMEKEVYQAKEYQEKLLNSLNDGVIAVNMDRVIIACNNAVEDMFGYRKEEIMGKSSLMMYPDRHAFENINRKAIRQIKADGHFEGEITVKHKNDRIFPVYASATLLLDQAGNPQGIVGVFQDLSEKKELERELEQQRLAAIRSDRLRSLGEMAAGIAHELNQPLSGVRGLAEHLLIAMDRGWNMIDKNVREKLSLIIEQADRMSHVIEHVRMFSKGSVWLEGQPTDSNHVVQSCLEMVGEQIRQRGVELVLELTDGLPLIDVNPFSLEEVLINILINARDAVEDRLEMTPDPSPRIVIRTMPETEDSNHIVKIEERELDIARMNPWGGSSAIIAADGLFSFGAHP